MTIAPPGGRVAVVANSTWNLHNFRRSLVVGLARAGYEVYLCAPADGGEDRLGDLPAAYVPLRHLRRRGLTPWRDLLLARELCRIYRRKEIRYALHFTAKPVVFGSLAARRAGVISVATLTGLGYTFLRGTLPARLMQLLYQLALRRVEAVVYHNPDDRDLLLSAGVGERARSYVVGGSGVPLDRFPVVPYSEAEPGRFLFVGRLLVDKGIREFVEAACQARRVDPSLQFHVVGAPDPGNPASIGEREIRTWIEEGNIIYHGAVADVRPHLARASVIVLPSYREGCPRSLLEAAATGRALIGTDVPGVREVVLPGRTGWLVEPRRPEALQGAFLQAAAAGPEVLIRRGRAARQLVEERFANARVIERYVELLAAL